jgi:TonB family protein
MSERFSSSNGTRLMVRTLVAAAGLSTLGCSAARVSSIQIRPLETGRTSCAAVPNADTTIYDTTQVGERAIPRSVPTPEYPAEARRRRIQGRAVVTAIVSPEGAVEAPSVTIAQSSNALLDVEARRIVSQATFWPACRDGMAVRTRIAIPFDFKLSGNTAAVGFAVIAGLWAGVMGALLH